jgi:hypothetical protein
MGLLCASMGMDMGQESHPSLVLLCGGTDHLDLLFGGQVGCPDDWASHPHVFIHGGF